MFLMKCIMVRRLLSMFFLLMATVSLVGHSIVPHHHHQGHACYANANLNSGSGEKSHQDDSCSHKSDNDHDPECLLKQSFVFASASGPDLQKRILILPYSVNHPDICICNLPFDPPRISQLFLLNPDEVLPVYTAFIRQGLGSRGSPVYQG